MVWCGVVWCGVCVGMEGRVVTGASAREERYQSAHEMYRQRREREKRERREWRVYSWRKRVARGLEARGRKNGVEENAHIHCTSYIVLISTMCIHSSVLQSMDIVCALVYIYDIVHRTYSTSYEYIVHSTSYYDRTSYIVRVHHTGLCSDSLWYTYIPV